MSNYVDVGPERRSPRYHETCLALTLKTPQSLAWASEDTSVTASRLFPCLRAWPKDRESGRLCDLAAAHASHGPHSVAETLVTVMGGSSSMVTRAAALPGRAAKMTVSAKHYVLFNQMEAPFPEQYKKVPPRMPALPARIRPG